LVVAGAVLFLGEKVSWRRWSAIIVGFIGVLMIVQPGGGAFESASFYAVGAMFGLAVRDLTTRMTPPGIASASLATFTMMAAAPAAAIWVLLTQDQLVPPGVNWLIVIAMVSIGAFGYLLLIASMRMADVSAVSPYRYLRLIFLLAIGVVFFGERPDTLTLAGAAVIILSGLYTMWRDRIVSRAES
jgi:drug/metabolite transporter (DMT)-like permease